MKYLYVIQETNSSYGKYGICNEENPNRILSGQTYYKNQIIIHKLYKIESTKDYQLYKDYDKIISNIGKNVEKIKLVENSYNIKLPYLTKLNKYLINGNGGTEIFEIKGLALLTDFITKELSLFKLSVIELTKNEINDLLKLIKKAKRTKNKKNYDIFNKVFGKPKNTNTQLRPYQKEITNYIISYYQSLKNNLYLNLATGGGKSFIVFYLLKQLLPPIVIIFSPRKKINQQNVGSKYINYLGNNYHIYNFSEDNGLTTFLKTKKKKIIVCCTQSADKLYQKIKQTKLNLNNIFIWFDEAHWGVENWINDTNKKYWLESKDIRYRLFTSASPDEKIVKTNQKFGEYYKPFTVRYLIDNQYLCKIIPYMYETNQNNVSISDYILKHFKEKNRKYGFSFHNRDTNAYNLFDIHYQKFKQNKTNIKPFLLIDQTNLKRQIDYISQKINYNFTDIEFFEKNSNSIAYVVKKYDMGYDFNKLDFITFSDPKLSCKDIIQCIGRGTRIFDSKVCHILLPIFVSDNKTEYDKIVNVLQYLINDVGIDFDFIFTNNSNNGSDKNELSSNNYKGTNKIKSIIIEKLNMIVKNLKQLERLCIKFDIKNEVEYLNFLSNNKYYKLKKNIYGYRGFKWKPIVDPNSEKYYDTYQKCEIAFDKIIENITNSNNENDVDILLDELNDEGIIKYNEYDKKIPPYNKLKECYY